MYSRGDPDAQVVRIRSGSRQGKHHAFLGQPTLFSIDAQWQVVSLRDVSEAGRFDEPHANYS
jgi:hypothetical protein